MKKTISMLIAWASISAFAQMTPAGLWHTIDDDTQLPKGEVRITATMACCPAWWCVH